jgi:hypothetical protein
MRYNFKTTDVPSKENFVLRLIQDCHDDNRVGPWMGDIMQSLPGERPSWRTCKTRRGETDCVRQGFLPVLSDVDRRLEQDRFHPPQTAYTGEPQEAQN